MKTYEPSTRFVTPPESQNQHPEVAWSIDYDAEVLLCRVGSGEATEYVAYAYPSDVSDEEAEQPFEPWNGTPRTGRKIGECGVAGALV